MEIDQAYYRTLLRSHELACELYDAWAGTPFEEPDEEEVEAKLNRLMYWIRTLAVDEEHSICGDCSGSGQGMTENSICKTCGGSGEV